MRSTCGQNEAEYLRLQARYRAAWEHFSVAVRRWQNLQVEEAGETFPLRVAETAAHAAEEQYRQARNDYADYLLEHSCREREVLLAGSRSM